jgi:hypothetical protein
MNTIIFHGADAELSETEHPLLIGANVICLSATQAAKARRRQFIAEHASENRKRNLALNVP